MSALLEQVLKLLTTDTGSLAFHLALALSLAGAFALTFNAATSHPSRRARRTLLGLGLLLGLQLGLFAASGLAWQGVINSEVVLPLLDRAVALLSLVVLGWLWAFPDPAPAADAGSLLLGLLGGLAALLTALWWIDLTPVVIFNGSLPDQAAHLAMLGVGALFCIYLVSSRPEGWGYGLAMLVTILMGAALHLLWLPDGQNYPAAFRLAQMAAYPFLLLLAQRLAAAEPPAAPLPALAAPSTYAYGDAAVWQSLAEATAKTDPGEVSRELTALAARTLQADLALMLQPPDADGRIAAAVIYDARAARYLEPSTLDGRAFPMILASLRMARARRFSHSSTSGDLAALARLFNQEQVGDLMLAPALDPSGRASVSLALLSGPEQSEWSADDLAFLAIWVKLLAQFLQRSLDMQAVQEELLRTQGRVRQAHDQAMKLTEERQKLRDQAAILQETAERDHVQLAGLASAAVALESARQMAQEWQEELEELRIQSLLAEERAAQQIKTLDGELRLSLEEIANLHNELGETDKRLSELKRAQISAPPSAGQLETLRAIVQEVRLPLASIAQQVDALLEEVAGILTPRQRKYLERVKISSGRIQRGLDDMLQAAAPESNIEQLRFEKVNLAELTRQAARDNERFLREKRIALQLDAPDTLIPIECDLRALRQIIEQLMFNARTITPQGGKMSLRACVETSEGEIDYVLLQVADGGPGIAAGDLLRVFSPRQAGSEIGGLNDPEIQMPRMKSLVESLGGRAWVDSEPGRGATFSILLPAQRANGRTSPSGVEQ